MAKLAGDPGSQGAHRSASRLLLLTVLTALVAGTCGSPTPSPTPTTAVVDTNPSASLPNGPAGSPDPNAPDATSPVIDSTGWSAVELTTSKPIASLVPTRHGAAGAATDTAFRLTSLDGSPVATLASHLEVQPALRLQPATPDGDAMLLRPTSRLTAGVTYRFTLHRADGSIARAWAVTAATPLRVVGTLPSDESTDVPRDTGIEFTFDQPGVTADAVKAAFKIRPSVAGRFEVHGRVVAFVPSSRLKASTLYTVTLHKGVPLPGTGQSLGRDVTVRFETKGPGPDADRLAIFDRLADVGTRDSIAIPIQFYDANGDDRITAPKTLPVTVHRLDGLKAATAADTRLESAPDWARSGGAPVATSGLTLVLRATAAVRHSTIQGDTRWWIQLPSSLKAGSYILTMTHAGLREQVLIQVTDLAAYALVSDTRTVVWVNSISNGKPVNHASVTLGGTALGRTDADGLRVSTTPRSMRVASSNPAPFYLIVRDGAGRAVFVPIGGSSVCSKCESGMPTGTDTADRWWHVLATDRQLLRATDKANVWGVLRARDGVAPKRVELRLQHVEMDSPAGVPILVQQVTPRSTGMFSTQMAFSDLPTGTYNVVLVADGVEVTTTWFEVGTVVKPAYTLEMSTDQRAVLVGTAVTAAVKANFFEGTPVGGVDLQVAASGDGEGQTIDSKPARTGADGTAAATIQTSLPAVEYDASEWIWQDITASPTLPEEASIMGHTSVAVFRSTALVGASAGLDGRSLTVTGTVNDVDFARMATADVGDWGVDPAGAPRAGARVTLTITEVIPTRHKIGTTYDFVTKRAAPVYEYGERDVKLGDRTVTTDAAGTYRLVMQVTGGQRSYRILARYTDEAGRQVETTTDASASQVDFQDASPRLVVPTDPNGNGVSYSIGDRVHVTMTAGHPVPSVDRYLFTVAHQGVRTVRVQDGPAFAVTFPRSWVPNADIRGVRFTGKAYEVSDVYGAQFDTADRRLQVALTPDAARYEPGGHVRIAIRTTDPSGHPVAATVLVQAVDEKLYAIGAANDIDILDSLYSWVRDGVIATAWSHRAPSTGSEGGDTGGGGGDREDFRDWLLFKVVDTASDGTASVEFDTSDDLTSWRVVASGLDRGLDAGGSTVKIPVGKPFFVETAIAPEYLTGETPVLRMRGYGSALGTGAPVSFTVTAASLGLGGTTVSAPAFAAASVTLPALKVGDHRITVAATSGTGAATLKDTLIRTIHVVDTRAVQGRTTSAPLTTGFTLPSGTSGFTTIALSDGGRGRVVPILLSIADRGTGRVDDALAARIARDTLRDDFAMPADWLGTTDTDVTAFQQPGGGVALLPYASPDLEMSVLAALSNDQRIDREGLRGFIDSIYSEPAEPRARRAVALAGLAALGEPVLDQVRTAARFSRATPIDRTWLAVAALAAGDETYAEQLEHEILAADGERQGPWVRLSLDDRETSITTTALLGMVAAGLGDPLAADMDAYVAANPPTDTLIDLPRAIAARSWAERVPGQDAAATVTVDGATKRVAIAPESPSWLSLTPAQLAGAAIAPVSGSVIVTTSWEGPLDPKSLHGDDVTTFRREVQPAGTDPRRRPRDRGPVRRVGERCRRRLLVGDGPCSVRPGGRSGDPRAGTPGTRKAPSPRYEYPFRVDGQRVDFCVTRDRNPVHQLRYIARVVTPGSYRWEPAVIQSSIIRDRGATLPAQNLEIANATQ